MNKPIPDGYHAVTPYLSVRGASEAIEFYKRAFGAEEIYRLEMGGGIGHAEIQIGNSRIMIADEFPDMPEAIAKSPATLGGTSLSLCLYVADVDAQFQRAVDAGASIKRPIENMFYGDRSGTLQDPFGHVWTLSTRFEEMTPDEMRKRMLALYG